MTASDIPLLAAARATDPADIQQDLLQGHSAAIFEQDGAIIGVNWCVPESYGNGWLHVKMPPQCVWKSDIWVDPEHRNKGIAGKMLVFVDREISLLGFDYSLAFSDALNVAVRSHGNKHGSQELGRIFYIRLLGLTLLRFRGVLNVGRWCEDRPFVIDLTDCV